MLLGRLRSSAKTEEAELEAPVDLGSVGDIVAHDPVGQEPTPRLLPLFEPDLGEIRTSNRLTILDDGRASYATNYSYDVNRRSPRLLFRQLVSGAQIDSKFFTTSSSSPSDSREPAAIYGIPFAYFRIL
jgi:hypothetical protein